MPLSAAAVDSQRVRLDAFRMRYGGGEGDYGTPRRIPRLWGARRNETERHYPCDDLSGGPGEAWFRAVTVDAARPSVFRWLCQLKVAPYSYDLLDNLGRRSPRRLTPGAERLERPGFRLPGSPTSRARRPRR